MDEAPRKVAATQIPTKHHVVADDRPRERELVGDPRKREAASVVRVSNAWKRKFGGMDVSEAKKLRALEMENARLKKLLAETTLENSILKEAAAKKW